MSLRPQQPIPLVPDDTARVARAAFRRGNPCLLLRDRLGVMFDDAGFADLYPKRGQPAYAPWRLALVTLLQFREGLSDRQAAEAVRAWIDWKYLLGLDLADPGFDYSVLCEFRARLGFGAWTPGWPDGDVAGMFLPCPSSTTPPTVITFAGRATGSRTGRLTRQGCVGAEISRFG